MEHSPDGRLLVTGSLTGAIKLWDARTGKELATLSGHNGGVGSVCYSPNGRQLASAGYDATVRLWDAESFQETAVLTGHTQTVAEVVEELRSGKFANIAERSGRAQDKDDGGGLETLRRDGYM